MSKINLTNQDFADFLVALLLDALRNPDEIIDENERWKELVERLDSLGFGSPLVRYYVKMPSENRMLYKRFRKFFKDDSNQKFIIQLEQDKDDEKSKTDKYKIKDIVKKAIRMINSEKQRTGWQLLSEEKVDKIVEYVIEKEI